GVVSTLARLLTARGNFLECESAASTDRRLGNFLLTFCLSVWVPPVFALGLAVLLAGVGPDALLPAGAVLIAWLLSPAVEFWVSRPRRPAEDHLTPEDHGELRRFARKTWSFFERFVGSEDHWLPP